MRVLVTGGAGFIGSNLCEALLHEGYAVRCLDNLSTGTLNNISSFRDSGLFEFVHGDIRDYSTCVEACREVDVVLHQAALGSVTRSLENPLDTNSCNIDGFLNMLWAAVKAGVRRFVYASSSSVYGDIADIPRREERLGNPMSPYAVSKRTDEMYAQVFANAYDIEVIGLRYFNVFGPRQNPNGPYAAVIPRFFSCLLNCEQPVVYGDGKTTRDFCYVENVVQANLRAMRTSDSQALNQIYNIGCGTETSLNRLFQMVKEVAVRYLIETGQEEKARVVEGIQPLYSDFRLGDIRHAVADTSKAARLLGFEAHVSVEEGLKRAVRWYAQLPASQTQQG